MIIFDMDGTLLNSNNEILKKSRKIMKELKEKNKIIVIATGRSVWNTKFYFDSSEIDYILANNGSVWYDMKEDKTIKKSSIDHIEFLDIIKENLKDIRVVDIRSNRSYYCKEYEYEEIKDIIMKEKDSIYSTVIKLKDYKKSSEFVSKINKNYQNITAYLMQDSFSDKTWLDLMPKNNNKANNVKLLVSMLKLNIEEVIAFGDGLNDIGLLETVGIGVAMGNALPGVKEKARYITDSNDEDGIYKFLKEHFKNKL